MQTACYAPLGTREQSNNNGPNDDVAYTGARGGGMGDVIPFRKRKASEKHKGKTLCSSGFHKWRVENAKQFDVKQGKLVTAYRCERCGQTKTEAL